MFLPFYQLNLFNRVTMDRAKLMRSVSNDHIPTRLGNSIQVGYPHFRHAKKVNRYVRIREVIVNDQSRNLIQVSLSINM